MKKRSEGEEDADFVWCLVFGWLINLWRQSQAENSSRARRLFIHTDTRTHGQTDGDCRLPAPKAFPRDKIYIISLSDSALIVGPNCVIHLTALIEQRRQLWSHKATKAADHSMSVVAVAAAAVFVIVDLSPENRSPLEPNAIASVTKVHEYGENGEKCDECSSMCFRWVFDNI